MEMMALISPLEVPDEVGLDGLGGEAQVGHGVHQHQELGEEARHQPVQQRPAQPPAGRDGPDLGVTSWKVIMVESNNEILFYLDN